MKKLLMLILCTMMLCGCSEKNLTDKPNEPDPMYIEGPCVVCENGEVLIVQNENNPIVLGTNDKSVFDGLTTGDVIKIECLYIAESYPAQTTIRNLEFIKDGKPEDIPQLLMMNLKDMGWVAVTE